LAIHWRRNMAGLALTGLLASLATAIGTASPAVADPPVDGGNKNFTLQPNALTVEDSHKLLPKGWQKSADLAWTTTGDAAGFHILTASASSGYAWSVKATLGAEGAEADRWIGNACLTGSGRRLMVAYAPRTFTNKPELFGKAAATAIVDLITGQVTRLPINSTLAYHSPGCGAGEEAVFTQQSGDDAGKLEARTRMFKVDGARAEITQTIVSKGQLTSVVPTPAGLVAAASGQLVKVHPDGQLEGFTGTRGVAFRLSPDSTGGVVYVQREGSERAEIMRAQAGVKVPATKLASGKLGGIGVSRAAAGRVFLTGDLEQIGSLPKGVSRGNAPAGAQFSTEGQLRVTKVESVGADGTRSVLSPSVGQPVVIEASTAAGAAVSFGLGLSGAPLAQNGIMSGSPSDPNETERYCSVARNDPLNQAMQPKPRQVEWAVDQAVTGNLYVQRPANWKNLGMAAYQPQQLFPPVPLAGGGRVPAQVMLGILAQESNLWQATSHALPGVTGNPLIGNYYGVDVYDGTSWNDWHIRWDHADCGYGVAQITDGMRDAAHPRPNEVTLPYSKQRAIALDFAANIAEGVRILQNKWNQTRNAGVTITHDGCRSQSLESWFFAVWAYNTGFYPNNFDGTPWGVGWANNPINPNYPQDRGSFLDGDYSHASHPQDWPYPEKVMGFAAFPPSLLEAPDTYVAGYRAAWWGSTESRRLVKPYTETFCTVSNDCYPGQLYQPTDPAVQPAKPGPCAHQTNGLYDLKCWWHTPVGWKDDYMYGTEVIRFDPGYAYQDDATSYPPNCSLAGAPSGLFIIDNLPDTAASVRPNCPRPSSNAGSFALSFGQDGQGNYPGKIDFHQMGGGYAGHFWFARARGPAHPFYDTLRVNGTWSFNLTHNGWGRVWVHLPSFHAQSQQATYEIDTGTGFANAKKRVILQNVRANQWVSLGAFPFTGTPKVRLVSDLVQGDGGDIDIAWDAAGFEILPGKPQHQIVGLGDSYSSGEGSGNTDYYPETDRPSSYGPGHARSGINKNMCHRSSKAWSRLMRPDHYTSVGTLADQKSPTMDYHLLACSGAVAKNLLPNHTVAFGEPKPTVNMGNGLVTGAGSFGELSQLDRGFLDENTTLVTFSIGGNDLEWARIIKECAASADNCADDMEGSVTREQAMRNKIENYFVPTLRTVLRQVHYKAPNAKIILMGYPELLDNPLIPVCGDELAFSPEEYIFFDEMTALIASSMTLAADVLRAEEAVPAYAASPIDKFEHKGVCGSPPGINGILLGGTYGELYWLSTADRLTHQSAQSFHPNNYGWILYGQVAEEKLWQIQ
jgi:hypothetical protein